MATIGDGLYQSAIKALEQARVTRTSSHIEFYLDIPSKMLPDVLRAKVSKRYNLPVLFITSNGTDHEWWTDGIVYNPLGGPSISVNSGQELKIIFHDSEGNEVNDNGGPAIIQHKFGVMYIEEWLTLGSRSQVFHRTGVHRDGGPAGGPAFTRFEYEIPNKQTWLEYTLSHNEAKDVSPKFLNPGDQVIVFREKEFSWYKKGKPFNGGRAFTHREDFCSAEHTRMEPRTLDMFQRSYTIKRKLRWRNDSGMEHRVDGPAHVNLYNIEETRKTTDDGVKKGAIKYRTWKTRWAVNGTEIATKHVLDWCRRNRVVLRDGPCFDQSVFVKAEDELCFITDFLKLN